ncbi:hypothetical protein GCM10025882_34730 [Acinetobacter gyllenbergii]|nr:hypothetical protein GCM10025882_34730 [Acinetobacter gyllenbergii]
MINILWVIIMHGIQSPKQDSQSKLIEGAGTGTSDSIKKNVTAGN